MRATINRNRSTALRGGDPDQLKDVQSYIAVKFRDAGQLDFQGVPGSQGQDTTWAQVSSSPGSMPKAAPVQHQTKAPLMAAPF
jgi:hypothetical protein